MGPPVCGILLGLVIGTVDPVRSVLVRMPGFPAPALGWLFEAVQKFGGAAVPMVMIVLGASLAAGFDKKSMHWGTAIGVTVARLAIVPAIAFSLVAITTSFVDATTLFGSKEKLQAAMVVML